MNFTLQTWQKIGAAATAFAALIALVSIAITLDDLNSSRKQMELREWQRIVVYQIISDNAPWPSSIDQILGKYVTKSREYETEIDNKELTEHALRGILLELIAMKAIVDVNEESYGVMISIMTPPGRNFLDNFRVPIAIVEVLLEKNSVERSELSELVGNRLSGVAPREIQSAITDGLSQKILVEAENGLISLN